MSGLNKFSGWLQRQKDSSSSFLLERALQRAIWDYGRMLKLTIDSRQKSAKCEVLLKGESEPVTLILQQYEIITEPAGTFVIIHKATASREWLTALLESFVRGKKIPVPEKYARVLRIVA